MIALGVISWAYLFWKLAPRRSAHRRGLAVMAGAALLVGIYGMSWHFIDHQGNVYFIPARWIARHVRPTETVGMFQTGTTGFLHHNVANLDGKVNAAALRALKEHRIVAYIDSMRFDYLIDRAEFIDPVITNSVCTYVIVGTRAFGKTSSSGGDCRNAVIVSYHVLPLCTNFPYTSSS